MLAGFQLTPAQLEYNKARWAATCHDVAGMTSLTVELSRSPARRLRPKAFRKRFGLVQVSDRPDLAQFQCNGALAAAKAAKTNPRAIAEKIAARLKAQTRFRQGGNRRAGISSIWTSTTRP